MARLEKMSIGLIFVVGLITMATAIIRSVSLYFSSSAGQVSTTWLMLWAGIEGVVAMIGPEIPARYGPLSTILATRALWTVLPSLGGTARIGGKHSLGKARPIMNYVRYHLCSGPVLEIPTPVSYKF
ncbi:hypothetical protein NHJ13051_007162 [Beauveria bassiana]